MSNAKILQALGNLFEKQRIVFWYDTRREFRADFESLELPGVEKIELANNGVGLSYSVLRELHEQRSPLYREIADVVIDGVRCNASAAALVLAQEYESLCPLPSSH